MPDALAQNIETPCTEPEKFLRCPVLHSMLKHADPGKAKERQKGDATTVAVGANKHVYRVLLLHRQSRNAKCT
jgi:hypothetical protein